MGRNIDISGTAGAVLPLDIRPPAHFPEQVRGMLEKAILDGRLESGQRVTEAQLADTFGVSRTPVREAMRLLEAQGLLVRRRGRGTHIASRTTFQEASVIYGLRTPLESYLTALAAERMSAHELRSLARLQTAFRAALSESPVDRQALVVSDSEFHWTIYRAARSDLVSIVNSYWSRFLRELSDQVYKSRPLERFANQHERISAALQARDADSARELMIAHIRSSHEAFSQSVRKGAGNAVGGNEEGYAVPPGAEGERGQ